MTDVTNENNKMGYWETVAQDKNKLGFWFVLPTILC